LDDGSPAHCVQHSHSTAAPEQRRAALEDAASNKQMEFTEHVVPRGEHRMYAREYAGEEPSIILMHGFPDNLHLYDRLVPLLSPPRRVVTFDFLGWGSSDKPAGYPYTAKNQEGDLDAVIRSLNLGKVVLVAHDASGRLIGRLTILIKSLPWS